jgi:hypothetical protein
MKCQFKRSEEASYIKVVMSHAKLIKPEISQTKILILK